MHLVWVFPISLFSAFVVHVLRHHLAVVVTIWWLLIGYLVVGSLSWCSHLRHHLNAHLVVILRAKLPDLRTGCWLIFVILVTA